jgi:hypothetical protein
MNQTRLHAAQESFDDYDVPAPHPALRYTLLPE